MKVPILESLEAAAPVPYQNTAPVLREEDHAAERVGQDVGQLGTKVGNLYDEYQREAEKTRTAARGLVVANASLDHDTQADNVVLDFRKLKGIAASEARSNAYKQLDDQRQKIADGITDPKAKTEYLTRSAESLKRYHEQIDQHVQSQFDEARKITLNARVNQGLGMAESGTPDEKGLTNQIEQDIRANAPTKEAGELLVERYRGDAAMARVTGMVADGKSVDANIYIDQNRSVLGGNYANAKKLVHDGVEVDKARQQDVTISNDVAKWANEVRDEKTLLDKSAVEKLQASVDKRTYQTHQERQRAEAEVDRVARLETAKREAEVQKVDNRASKVALIDWKEIDPADRQFLERYDSKRLIAIEAEKAARIRAWKASQRADKSSVAAEERAQRAVDAEASALYRAALIDDPTTDRETFLRDFVAQKADAGDNVTVTDKARALMTLSQKQAAQRATTTDSRADTQLAASLEKTFKSLPPPKKGAKPDEHDAKVRVGAAMDEYDRRVAANGGKPLDAKAVQDFQAEMTQQAMTAPTGSFLGLDYGAKKVPAVDLLPGGLKGPPAAPKAAPPAAAKQAAGSDMVRVRSKKTGKTGSMPRSKFNPDLYDLVSK